MTALTIFQRLLDARYLATLADLSCEVEVFHSLSLYAHTNSQKKSAQQMIQWQSIQRHQVLHHVRHFDRHDSHYQVQPVECQVSLN